MDAREEIEFFDRFEASHHEYDVLGPGAYARLLSLFEAWVKPVAGEVCVDLGCGTGAFTKQLRRYSLRLTGMDISPRSVARANAEAAGERYVVGDIRDTGLATGSVDIVCFSGVLHHLLTRETRQQVLREAHRILRPGGRVFAYDPSAHSPSMRLYRDPRSPLYSSEGKTANEVLLDRAELEADFGAGGFERVRVAGAAGITFRYVEGRIARLLLPLYNVYERALRASPLEDRYGTFLVSFGASKGG